jgi:4'-phosphopantetheinyl transferase
MKAIGSPAPGQVHLWPLWLDLAADEQRALQAVLSADELARAARLADPLLRQRFITGRGQLRVLLGRYTGQPAHALAFTYNAHGRPSLAGSRLRFNVTHAAGRAICAVAFDIEIGVDVERVQALPELDALARRVMSPLERMMFDELPMSERLMAFHRCWTRKEACLKACGVGIGRDLRNVSVSLCPDQAPRVLQLGEGMSGDGMSSNAWQLRAWEHDGEWVGAVAAETGGRPLDVAWQRPWPVMGQASEPVLPEAFFSISLQEPARSVPGPERACARSEPVTDQCSRAMQPASFNATE